uniref:Uncharacterized protein n=1 Tax=Rhizophora mucronata TaxID=61149 RepID=A0A2P2PQ37_RHIMU
MERHSYMRLLVNIWVDKPLLLGFNNHRDH